MSSETIKYETQVKYAVLSAAAATILAGGDNEVASFNLDVNFKKAIGVKVIPIDMAGLTQFDIAIQHSELTQRDAIDYRDWTVSNGAKYIDTFKPINIGAKGTPVTVRVKNLLQAIAMGQILRFQIIFLLTNDEV